jgi:antitoxin (DNA-binding transcriptional repressor) of toxin-antitoxin stability system
MDRYSLQEAQTQLKKLIADAQHGKTVVIVSDDEQGVQFVPIKTSAKPRKAGSARGLIKMAADFDSALE